MNCSYIKKAILVLPLLVLSIVLLAQQPELAWAEQFEGNIKLSASISHDDSGNVYTTGLFSGTVDFDPGPGIHNLTCSGAAEDIFISKLDASGNFKWVKQIKVTISAKSSQVMTDAIGNVFLGGEFEGTIDFDPGPGVFNLNSTFRNIFILKINAAGDFAWAKQSQGSGYAFVNAMTIDNNGYVYFAGWFHNTVDLNPGSGIFNVSNVNTSNGYILKLDSSGNFLWAGDIGKADYPTSIAIDNQSNVYLAGNFGGGAFDPSRPGNTIVVSQGGMDFFILKLNSLGKYKWVKPFGGNFPDRFISIITDRNDCIYATGYFEGALNTYPVSGTSALAGAGANYPDIFIIKLDSNGGVLWTYQIGGNLLVKNSGHLISTYTNDCISLDGSDGVYITGTFNGTIFFDPVKKDYTINSKGDSDIFISKFSSSGNFIWAKQIGGVEADDYPSISCDSIYIYATGNFRNNVDFDPGDSTVFNLTAGNNNRSVFVIRWNKCESYRIMPTAVCDSFQLNNQTYNVTGKYYQKLRNHKGCDSTIILDLTIIKRPKAKFTVQTQTGCQYVQYIFTDSSIADTVGTTGYTYHWSFGDGTDSIYNSISTIRNFNHVYTSSGTYTVRLIFSNGFCSDTFSVLNKVFILPAPKPGFILNKNKGCTPFIFHAQDTLTTDIVLKEYDFGNGYVFTNNQKSFDTIVEIKIPGIHIIRQRLTGTTGCVTQSSDTLEITPGLTFNDTVNVLYTTVTDSNTTFTKWNALPHAVSYSINNINTIDTFYMDHSASPTSSSQHYFVSAMDSCGNKSALSHVAQTIHLKAVNRNFNEFALLEYTPYETWKLGVLEYRIEYFDQKYREWIGLNDLPGKVLNTQAEVLPDSSDFNTGTSQICYRIKAFENNGGQKVSISNVECIPIYPVALIPTAFSPNNDGLNDYYKPYCTGLSIYIFEIYDRWGERVYSDTPESKGWDGKYNGKNAESGIYVYRLAAVGLLNSPYTNASRVLERQGTILLVR